MRHALLDISNTSLPPSTSARVDARCRWQSIDFLQAALKAAGQAFDTAVVSSTERPDFSKLLWNADGTGAYKGIIM
jgi:hypothetical protein